MTVQFFSAALNGTIVGKPDATLAFKKTWSRLAEKHRPILCCNSGRLLDDVKSLLEQNDSLAVPDYIIAGIGTEIFDVERQELLTEIYPTFDGDWKAGALNEVLSRFPEVHLRPPEFQGRYKSSWVCHDADPAKIREVSKALEQAGLSVNLFYTDSHYLDIVPLKADKGRALSWLLQRLEISPADTIVAGDSGHDASMFLIEGVRGIIVENAQPELYEHTVNLPVFWSRRAYADGVMEGLQHYGVLTRIRHVSPSSYDRADHFEPEICHLFEEDGGHPLSRSEHHVLDTAYEKALEAVRRNITPLGFSACSIDDNETTGTDANYRSVWARDSALTILGTLFIDDEEIRACQRRTLETLLHHTSPNGHVPAHVLIDEDTPEYAGVGQICSIDSGIWFVIALYEYIAAQEDHEMLDQSVAIAERVMHWLSAHDSNRDALLEIPEAGDWTDLFGRSYNVLYDEVLWYRANVAFGRLLELAGRHRDAGDYLRHSRSVKAAILRRFWPSTRHPAISREFTDLQFTLGDTRYLLAEVTPFSFNWRCDVYGNILAALYGVMDIERAKTAFRFMWEVGVNQPYPVCNLYPAVQSGDPDWRSYYLVNLLNLPHHYHNAGIWGHVGGMWVRFVHRFGLQNVAMRELLRLAELNRKGKYFEWEFNEWAHGITGKPMGKAYQAWTAASFIQAYQDLVPTG